MSEQSLTLGPFAAVVNSCTNRQRDRIKLLFWDRNGFWLQVKRLEADGFTGPAVKRAAVEIMLKQSSRLLDKADIDAKRRHPRRSYEVTV